MAQGLSFLKKSLSKLTNLSTLTPKHFMAGERKLGYTLNLNNNVDQCTKEDILKIKALIEQHGVVCIKNQQLEAPSIYKFCSMLGRPMALPEGLAFNNMENPYVTRIGNVRLDGSVEQNQMTSLYWHSDGDITEAPHHFIYIMLNAKIVPPTGGKTGFLDMRTLYQDASEEIKEWLKDASIEVKIADIDDFIGAKEAENMPNVAHKVNQIHPVRQIPSFYLCAHQGFVTLKTGEVLKTPDVMSKVFDEKYMYQHEYEQGDLVIWDDIQVHHRSLGGFGNHKRLLFRGQVEVGDVPELIEYVKN